MTAISSNYVVVSKALLSRYRKVLSLQERALLFAKSLKEDDLVTQTVEDFGLTTGSKKISEEMALALFLRINTVYRVSAAKLLDRLTDVGEKYSRLHEPSDSETLKGIQNALADAGNWWKPAQRLFADIEWPDRDTEAITLSKKLVGDRFEALATAIEADIKKPPLPVDDLFLICDFRWEALDDIAFLITEEISFLSRRIDNYCNTQVSVRRLWVGIVAIIISAFLSGANLWWNMSHTKGAIPPPDTHASVNVNQ